MKMRLLPLLLLFASGAAGQALPDTTAYVRRSVMIPMRDGVKLNTVIYAPRERTSALPILFMRTPYGADKATSPNRNEYIADMAREGYIFVFQDIRGRYRSEGTFE